MIEITKDKKSGMYIITRTDSEGFHKQMTLTKEEIITLKELINGKLKETV